VTRSAATEVNPDVTWRNHGPFCLAPAGVILPTCPGRPPKHEFSTWAITDKWPERVPVAEAEAQVFEQWFADLFDELFGPAP
jgi:hypothetical protein